MSGKLKILLVMQDIPLQSGFLARKFIGLSKYEDVHLLVWDEEARIDKFIEQYNLPDEVKGKIHIGANDKTSIISLLVRLVFLFISDSSIRKYILQGTDSLASRLKFIAYYLPVFSVMPDIIHFEFGTLAKNLALLKPLTKAKILVSFRGYDINYVGLNEAAFYKEVWEYADGLHFLGQDLRNRAIKRGYKGNKIECIIPPAVDISFFMPGRKMENVEKLIITSVGRLVWKKGYEFGILAASLLKKKGVPFEYRIIGAGPQLQAFQFTISELGLDNEVHLYGEKTAHEVKEYLEQSNVFLHPAISEGFCNAVIEAQAMALPVLCTDADGLKENIKDAVTGFVVPKWDAEAIAEKLDWFWKHPEKIISFGQAGRQRAQQYFGLSDQVSSFLHFYRQIHDGRAKD